MATKMRSYRRTIFILCVYWIDMTTSTLSKIICLYVWCCMKICGVLREDL